MTQKASTFELAAGAGAIGDGAGISARSAQRVLFGMIAIWMLLEWTVARPEDFSPHWRQAETASIAVNYVERGFELLRPRINWGGDGPGYVEAEFMAYPTLVMALTRVVGTAPWTGQAVSLVIGALTAVALYQMLRKRFGEIPALLGAGLWLTSRLGIYLSVAVMPDGLCGLFYVLGLSAFLDYRDDGKVSNLVWAMLGTVASALVKPYALQLGIAQFMILAFSKRERLRSPWIWIGWTSVLAVVSAHLWYAHSLYLDYGNTFGVIAGGDTKFPGLKQLKVRFIYEQLTYVCVGWGVGLLGIFALVFLAQRKKLGIVEIALTVANGLQLFVSLRYSSHRFQGSHYHVFSVFAAAWFVAHAYTVWVDGLRPEYSRAVLLALSLLFVGRFGYYVRELRMEHAYALTDPVLALGHALKPHVHEGELVIVRSGDDAADSLWGTEDNYQDPRLMFVAHTRGWVLPHEELGKKAVSERIPRGARFYVETREPKREDPELYAFLKESARTIHTSKAGTIWQLAAP